MATGTSLDEGITVEETSVVPHSKYMAGEGDEDLSDEEDKIKGKKPPPSLDMTSAGDANSSGPKTPTSMSRHKSERERKIGHRRVGVGGEITYKKIQTSQIMGSIQLGIQHAVGGLASKPERDLLMQDFMTVETCNFPTMGSNHTPAHHFTEFRFKNYAPIAFRYFRDLFGIQPDDYLMSMCSAPLRELQNPGASGSIFYLTEDDEFIIKTVQHKEGEFLQKLLPGYYMNLNQNPRTLLPKFFGLYCYQCNSKNVRLVAMNNLLPSSITLHQKYDLKGSTYKRKANKFEKSKKSPTYKDLDFMEHHPEGIFLEADTYSALIKTIQRDCRVLESFKIMDYSLLVGVHNLDQCAREKLENANVGSNENLDSLDSTQPDSLEREENQKGGGIVSLNRSKSINRQRLVAHSTAMESIQAESEPIDQQDDVPPGGIPARNAKGERLLLFMGIIDILQSYRLKKKLEHTWKAMIHDGDTVSVHRPGFYAQRFQDFMAKTVFKKIPSLDLPEIKGNHRKFRTLVSSYIALKHSPSKRKSISRVVRPLEPDSELGCEKGVGDSPEYSEGGGSSLHFSVAAHIPATAFVAQTPSCSKSANNGLPPANKTANPVVHKTSPPKAVPLSPTNNFTCPVFPAVLDRNATLPQKSKVPPPVPPRGSPRPKRDLPASRGFANSCSGIPSCSTPPPAFEDAVRGDTPRHRNTHHIRSYREESASVSEVSLDHKSSLSVESSSSTSGFASGTTKNLTWTPPASVEGSTPTWTEGTPSFTESSSSGDIGCPTTPIRTSHYRRNSSGPKSLADDGEHATEMNSIMGYKSNVIAWGLGEKLLYILVFSVFVSAEYIQTSLTIQDILPENPKHYDKMQPPKKEGHPTVVFFHVTVMGLDSIDENAMTYAADIFFAQTWKDHRLRLPENMTSEYRLLEVEWLKNMWRPDSFFKNAKAVTFQTMTIPNHYVWLYKDKTILYMVKLTLTLSCAMNFMIYPHDTQECKLQMESLSHTTEDMIFQWDPDVPLVVDENIELPQLQLIKNYTADCTQVYSTGNFTCLEVVFVLKRRLGYYLFHTYIPACLIVIMSWVSFWIKPEAAPARVTLGVTSLLTLSTQHAKSQAALPPVSYLKAVDGFMSVCTVFVFMALMEYCLVNIMLGDNDGPKNLSEASKVERIFDLASKENSRLISNPSTQTTAPNPAARSRDRAINIDRFSRIFFPLLFAVLNGTYWIMFYQYL